MTTPTTQREADERAQKALAAITERLALTYRICCGTSPKQSVGELLDVTINMPEWEIVRAAIDQSTRQAAPEAPAVEDHDWMGKIPHRFGNPTAATDQPSAGLPAKTWEQSPYLPNYYESQAWARGWNDARASLTPTAPAGQVDASVQLLREFVDHHAKPAGMTVEIAMNTERLGEFLHGVEAKEKSLVARAQALLASLTPTAPAEQMGAGEADERLCRIYDSQVSIGAPQPSAPQGLPPYHVIEDGEHDDKILGSHFTIEAAEADRLEWAKGRPKDKFAIMRKGGGLEREYADLKKLQRDEKKCRVTAFSCEARARWSGDEQATCTEWCGYESNCPASFSAPATPTAPQAASQQAVVAEPIGYLSHAALDRLKAGRTAALLPKAIEGKDRIALYLAPQAATTASSRDWMEDYADGENQYQCECSTCGHSFFGHKRRVTCKACAVATTASTQKTVFVSVGTNMEQTLRGWTMNGEPVAPIIDGNKLTFDIPEHLRASATTASASEMSSEMSRDIRCKLDQGYPPLNYGESQALQELLLDIEKGRAQAPSQSARLPKQGDAHALAIAANFDVQYDAAKGVHHYHGFIENVESLIERAALARAPLPAQEAGQSSQVDPSQALPHRTAAEWGASAGLTAAHKAAQAEKNAAAGAALDIKTPPDV